MIEIIQADITKLEVDVIVNAANNSLMGGGGVDGAIHRAAGKALADYCFGLRGCATGEAKITPGFALPAKFVIHAVGPVWNNGTAQEEQLLSNCYTNSMRLAMEYQLKSIAFPCISTGAYRFPFELAATIALRSITASLANNNSIEKVLLVVFAQRDFERYQKRYQQFIKI
jgi:O-acetyl-ADP-ribose deacetylase